MSNIRVGDKVSFVNERLGGTVKALMGKGKVLVLLDDGFEIPVSEGELVVVSSGRKDEAAPTQEKLSRPVLDVDEKIYMSFVGSEGKTAQVKAWLLNNTSKGLLYAIYRHADGKNRLVAKGEMQEASALQLAAFQLSEADHWKNWTLQLISYQNQPTELPAFFQQQVKIRPAQLMQEKHRLPFLEEAGLLVPVQAARDEAPMPAAPKKGGNEPLSQVEKVDEVIDLHIEALLEPGVKLSPSSMLTIQLEHFINTLEKAVAFRLPRIIFIHGIGNGHLKNAIRSRLDKHPEVERYEDADTKIFGYGATAVYLKSR